MRNFFAELIFWMHLFVVLFWYSLFFIPQDWWPDKVSFLFHLTLGIVLHQFVWGFMIMPWVGKYRMVCILTTIMQYLRGQKISDSKNYDHSFSQEFFGRRGITIPHRATTFLTLAILIIVTFQYLSP